METVFFSEPRELNCELSEIPESELRAELAASFADVDMVLAFIRVGYFVKTDNFTFSAAMPSGAAHLGIYEPARLCN